MQTSLALTALVMGLAGGVHCTAMCGSACAAAGGGREGWLFLVGRVVGYATLGAAAAASMQAMAWLGAQTAALRPLWTFMHVAALLLGLTLLIRARQPQWIERSAQRIWYHVRHSTLGVASAFLIGMLWALLPCGLLYSALLVAALAGDIPGGALVMAMFALGSATWLVGGPWLLRLAGQSGLLADGIGIRVAGLVLAALSVWALYMDVVHRVQVFCL